SPLPAAALTARTRHGPYFALAWIAHRSRIFRVTGVCGGADWERYRPEFERTAASVRPLRSDEKERIVQSRLRIRAARAGESIAELLARGGATWTPAQAALVNGVAPERRLDRDSPAAAVSWHKQRRLTRLAQHYLKWRRLEGVRCRFDVIAVTLDAAGHGDIAHVRGAFDAIA